MSDSEGTSTSVPQNNENASSPDSPPPLRRSIDGIFFKFLPEKSCASESKTVVQCVKCEPKIVELKGYGNSSSNFVTHLKRRHGNDAAEEYKNHLRSIGPPNKKIKTFVKQLKIKTTQENFESEIMNFFLHSMVPLRCVEDPHFIKIFDTLNISNSGLHILSRRSLCRKIDTYYEKNKIELNENLKDAQFVCTTVDIWSGKKRSFLGVTCHWISSTDLKRVSKALACRRFKGSHTYDRISDLINEIHLEFNLNPSKIIATVTDNGSNFVKAFKMFGVKRTNIIFIEEENSVDNIDTSEFNLESNESNQFQCDVHGPSDIESILPMHFRCFAHTLNLCVTADINKVINNSDELSLVHVSVINKCNILWNLAGRPKSAEIIQNILGHTLSRPGETRWNSLYDALRQILNIKKNISNLNNALNINKKNCLREQDFDYIEEHLLCTAPMAEALDIMQGETNTYYGIVLPCLLALRRKIETLAKPERIWLYCKPIIDAILKSIDKRFENYLNFSSLESVNASIAAFSYPRFKKRWLTCVNIENHDKLIHFFKKAADDVISAQNTPLNLEKSPIINQTTDDFFDFGSSSSASTDLKTIYNSISVGMGCDEVLAVA
ncbi:hypothetical protein ACI65C_000400 [Semiaphis heraclei]